MIALNYDKTTFLSETHERQTTDKNRKHIERQQNSSRLMRNQMWSSKLTTVLRKEQSSTICMFWIIAGQRQSEKQANIH